MLEVLLTGKGLGFVGGDGSEMLQVALITYEHDDDVLVCVVSQLLEPAGDIFVGRVLGNVVDEKGTDCAAVVC